MQIPGFVDVVATSIHVKDAQANGLLWTDNTAGDNKGALQNFQHAGRQQLYRVCQVQRAGDLDAFMGLAPAQIGNRLWYDTNRNGIEDADEEPVTDTVVELVDCDGNLVDTTRMDSRASTCSPSRRAPATRCACRSISARWTVGCPPSRWPATTGGSIPTASSGTAGGGPARRRSPDGTTIPTTSVSTDLGRPNLRRPNLRRPIVEQPPEPAWWTKTGRWCSPSTSSASRGAGSSTRLSFATADHAASTACACATGCPLGSLTSARQGRAVGLPAVRSVGASRRCRVGEQRALDLRTRRGVHHGEDHAQLRHRTTRRPGPVRACAAVRGVQPPPVTG